MRLALTLSTVVAAALAGGASLFQGF